MSRAGGWLRSRDELEDELDPFSFGVPIGLSRARVVMVNGSTQAYTIS